MGLGSAGLYFATGIVHGLGFFATRNLNRVLGLTCLLLTIRCAALAYVTGLWRLAAIFDLMATVPLALGYSMGCQMRFKWRALTSPEGTA